MAGLVHRILPTPLVSRGAGIGLLIGLGLAGMLVVLLLRSQPRLATTYSVRPTTTTWELFQPADLGFQVAFPGQPEQVTETVTIDQQPVASTLYRVIIADGTSYLLRSLTYPVSVDLTDHRLQLGRMIKAVLTAEDGNEFEQTRTLTLPGGGAGVDLWVTNSTTNNQLRLRFIILGQQVVVMSAAGPPGTTPESEVFFDSLSLLSPMEAA
ncbi:hypothetical protein HY523_01215 [Candidatus Berkelbacteria bacterium]|nr:hypothetical protein [Candidatus Berkelbacteria bacterium]